MDPCAATGHIGPASSGPFAAIPSRPLPASLAPAPASKACGETRDWCECKSQHPPSPQQQKWRYLWFATALPAPCARAAGPAWPVPPRSTPAGPQAPRSDHWSEPGFGTVHSPKYSKPPLPPAASTPRAPGSLRPKIPRPHRAGSSPAPGSLRRT